MFSFSFVRVGGLLIVQFSAALDDRKHCWGWDTAGEKSGKARMRQPLKLRLLWWSPSISLTLFFFFFPTYLTLPVSLATTAHGLGTIVTMKRCPLLKSALEWITMVVFMCSWWHGEGGVLRLQGQAPFKTLFKWVQSDPKWLLKHLHLLGRSLN